MTELRHYEASRYFNQVKVDLQAKVVVKTSRWHRKLADEYHYYLEVPQKLQHYFPEILGYRQGRDFSVLEMSLLPGQNLALAWRNDLIDEHEWDSVLQSIAAVVLDQFSGWTVALSGHSIQEMFFNKNFRRLEALAASPVGRLLNRPYLRLNGQFVMGWNELRPTLERVRDSSFLGARGQIIHGDLCLSNILYDSSTSSIGLVDPRGSFPSRSITGDVRYDVAKLYHSTYGNYDLIASGEFSLTGNTSLHLDFPVSCVRRRVRAAISHSQFSEFSTNEMLMLAGLQLIGGLALHGDSIRRQAAMYLSGLLLLEQALNDTQPSPGSLP